MVASDEEVWDDEVVVEVLPPKWWKPKDAVTQKLFDQCRLEITALLIASVEGLPSDTLMLEYKEITGNHIPYKELGFVTFFEFLYHAQDSMRVGMDKLHGTLYYFFNREECPVFLAIKDLREQVVSQQVSTTVKHLANLGCRGLISKVNFLSHKCLLEIDKKTDPTVPPANFDPSKAPRRLLRNGKSDCKNVIRAGFSHLQTAEPSAPIDPRDFSFQKKTGIRQTKSDNDRTGSLGGTTVMRGFLTSKNFNDDDRRSQSLLDFSRQPKAETVKPQHPASKSQSSSQKTCDDNATRTEGVLKDENGNVTKGVLRYSSHELRASENRLPLTSEKIKKIDDETVTPILHIPSTRDQKVKSNPPSASSHPGGAQKTFTSENVGTHMSLMLAPMETLKVNPAEQLSMLSSDSIAQSQFWCDYSDYPLEESQCPDPHKDKDKYKPVVEHSIGMYDNSDAHPLDYMRVRRGPHWYKRMY